MTTDNPTTASVVFANDVIAAHEYLKSALNSLTSALDTCQYAANTDVANRVNRAIDALLEAAERTLEIGYPKR